MKSLLIQLIFISIYTFAIAGVKTESKSKPNFIFYLADDQDILDYGCYGNDKVHTPAVDGLAKQGMKFSNAFTGQAICAPSRSQLYSGMYPVKNGCFANHTGVKPNIKTVIQYLKEEGYDVILAGKSHVKPASVFDWTYWWKDEKMAIESPHDGIPITKITKYLNTTEKPFCMFITSHFPHGPFAKGDKYNKKNIKWHPYLNKSSGTVKKKIGYYHNIEIDDAQLESVLNVVDSNPKLKNTVFIYSSDHGSSGKYTTYNRGLNIPFIVRWPGVVKEGTTSDAMIHYTDVLPTYLELAGAPPATGIDGKSFAEVIKYNKYDHHEYVYGVDTHQNLLGTYIFPSRMVMNKSFKYIRNFNSIEVYKQNLGDDQQKNKFIERGAKKFSELPYEELYDLNSDPHEQNNLAKDSDYSMIKKGLIKELMKWMKQQDDFLLKYKMPLIKPTGNPLDKKSKSNTIPKELEGILVESEIMPSHF